MKIAFFNSIATWGGGEKWHFDASVYFASQGHQVYFFGAPNGSIAQKLTSYKAVKFIPTTLSNTSFLNPLKLNSLKQSFKSLDLDIVIINHPGDLKIAAHAAHLADVPHIIYRRGSAIAIKDRFLNRYIFKNWVTGILANSQATKQTINALNANLFDPDKIKVIYNPIDVKEFIARGFEPVLKETSSELILGSLGRLAPQKNQFYLIDLSKALKQAGIAHKIYIAGVGALQEELQAYSKANQTQDTVFFIGFLDNVKDLLMCIDVFILPSLWEGFGYVLAEASLCKKPIVAFDVSSNPELVIDNQSGYLVPLNDLTTAIEKIKLLTDPQLREKLGEFGFEYCSTTFENTKIAQQLTEYFTGLVQKRPQ